MNPLFFYSVWILSIGLLSILYAEPTANTSATTTQETDCQKCMKRGECSRLNLPQLVPCRYILNVQGIQTACCCTYGYLCDNSYTKSYDPTHECRCLKPKDRSKNTLTPTNEHGMTMKTTTKKPNYNWFLFLLVALVAGVGVFYWLRQRRKKQSLMERKSTSSDSPVREYYPSSAVPPPVNAIPQAQPVMAQPPVMAGQPIGPNGPGVQYVTVQPTAPQPSVVQQQSGGMGAGTGALLGGAAGLATGMMISNALNHHHSVGGGDQHVFHHYDYNQGGYGYGNGNGGNGAGYDTAAGDMDYEYVAGEF